MTKLLSVFPIHCSGEAVSHTFLSLCRTPNPRKVKSHMVVPGCEPKYRGMDLTEAIPPKLSWLYYKTTNVQEVAEKRFLKMLKHYDVAYCWPGISLETLRRVKATGKPLVIERINCYTGKAKQILDEAYTRLGLEPLHPNTSQVIQEELETVALADLIWCPSPEVKQSFLEAGVADRKLILTSYGWSPQRFPNSTTIASRREQSSEKPLTVLFVGFACVRKGVHLLMKAFERSGIQGRLLICGKMEPAIAQTCKELLNCPNIVRVEYNSDISGAFQEADVFAFPSLEEGGPQVTYEAMAYGLPVLVSPMGAGSIVRDGLDGWIVPPDDEAGWVESLRKLAASPELRTQFGRAAYERAQLFTWDRVAARRVDQLVQHLS